MLGAGAGTIATTTGAQVGLWQVATSWGFAVAIAILTTSAVSGAHLNPAISVAFAAVRPKDFPIELLGPYVLAQFLGFTLGYDCCSCAQRFLPYPMFLHLQCSY